MRNGWERLAGLALAGTFSATALSQTITALPNISAANAYSRINYMSDDGSSVIANITNGADFAVWRWRAATGWQQLTGNTVPAVGISGDGSVVVAGNAAWRDGAGWRNMPIVTAHNGEQWPLQGVAVSADSNPVVFGRYRMQDVERVCRVVWNGSGWAYVNTVYEEFNMSTLSASAAAGGQALALEEFTNGIVRSRGVALGYSLNPPPGPNFSEVTVRGVSSDASRAVGYTRQGSITSGPAVYWDTQGMHTLPHLPGATASAAIRASNTGVIVGISGGVGCVWENGQPRTLREYLLQKGVGLPATFLIGTFGVSGISGDGRTLAGTHTYRLANGAVVERGWMATLGPDGTPPCTDLDFNNDTLFPDFQDIEDFFIVASGGDCSTGDCDDTDFNGDGLFPDYADIADFLNVFSGGGC